MPLRKQVSTDGRRGISLLITAGMSLVMFGITGLSIDAGILYVARTKLSTAADAAVLAGARSLSRGADLGSQSASATTTTQNYFTANFPNNFFVNAAPTISTTVTQTGLNLRTVTTTATAQVPVYFLRAVTSAGPTVTVTVTAAAQRRDTNLILVMDRSGSLANSGSCAPMVSASTGFVNMFAENADYLGLVTFASSSYYDYPITTTFKSSTPSLVTQIAKIACVGGTSSAMGLWNGYSALANLGLPGALNIIVFFTDGQPTAFTGSFPVKSSSTCTNFGTSPKHTTIMGVLTEGGSPWGLLSPAVSALPVSDPPENSAETTDPTQLLTAGTNNCAFRSGSSPIPSTDISGLPASGTDYYGDTLASGYQSPVNVTSGSNIDNASVNAADEAAKHIRNGDPVIAISPGANLPPAALGKSVAGVVILSIGLGNASTPPNADFLERVANDPRSSSFDSTQTPGIYVVAQTASDLDQAFQKVAAQVLRLSQ
jgi:Flp pilus assembly protein TadG